MSGSILLTGGTGFIGSALAKAMASSGRNVAFTYCNRADEAIELEHELEKSGRRALALHLDFEDEMDFEELIGRVERRVGEIASLILSSSYFPRENEETPEMVRRIMRVNIEGPYMLATAAARLFKRRGRGKIVFILDTAGEKIFSRFLAYSVSRAAGFAMVRGLAKKFAPEVQVNGVSPGIIREPSDLSSVEREALLGKVPMGRWGTPDEVVKTVSFLLEGPGYVTGEIIGVDGGYGL